MLINKNKFQENYIICNKMSHVTATVEKKEVDILWNWEALLNNAANCNFKWGHRCQLPESLPVWQLLVHRCWWTVHAIKELITIIAFVGIPGISQELQGHPWPLMSSMLMSSALGFFSASGVCFNSYALLSSKSTFPWKYI